MPKPIRSLDFSFVPFPAEVWDEDIPLALGEFRLLGYLCKQIRFGEALRALADEELMHGIYEDGRRKDKGCGLSRNGIKKAREALVERGWLNAENISDDVTRPRWQYRLLLGKKGEVSVSQRDSSGVTERQLVSQRDTVTPRQLVSPPDSAVSRGDSDGVTARQPVSQRDTCNKEEETSKNLDQVLETPKAKITTAPVENHEATAKQKQNNLDTWDLRRYNDELQRLANANAGGRRSGDGWDDCKLAALRAGLTPDRHVQLLKKFFPNDPSIDQIYAPPPLFQPQPAESEEEVRATIERSFESAAVRGA